MIKNVFQVGHDTNITKAIDIVVVAVRVLMDKIFLATLGENDVKSHHSPKPILHIVKDTLLARL